MSREFILGRLGVRLGVGAFGFDFFGDDRIGDDGAGDAILVPVVVDIRTIVIV